MVRRLLPLCLVLGAGCASAPPIVVGRPVEVRVPIYEPAYCAVAIPDRPALPIAGLKPDSSPAAEVKAYAASVALLKAAVLEREDLLGACVKPAGGTDQEAPSRPSPDQEEARNQSAGDSVASRNCADQAKKLGRRLSALGVRRRASERGEANQ